MLYIPCISSITPLADASMPALVQRRDNKPAAMGQFKCVWFGAVDICQSSGDSAGTNRPGGISGKSGESISAPKRFELWQEARERERDEHSICEAGGFIQ